MTNDDWRALLEDYLSDGSDTETFKDAIMEALKDARADKLRIPGVIDELGYMVEPFDLEDDDESELRDEAEKALKQLNKTA